MAWRPWMSCAFDYDLSQPWLQEVYFFSPRCHDCRNFSKFIMNKACNFQCKVTYIKITNTLISALRRKSLKESRDLFVHNSLYFHRHSNSGPPFFLIWSLPRLWYGSLSGSISLSHLSIFYNISFYNSLVLLTFVSRSSCRITMYI